jgi:predicted  nucleic acid-binding Zn-ribbon protein
VRSDHDAGVAPRPLDRILGLPADLAQLLGHLPAITRNTAAIEDHTARLDAVATSLERVANDTTALPAVRDALLVVVESTAALKPMSERLASIEAAMPALVDVQKQLGELPAVMQRLDEGIERLSDLMERMLVSMDALGGNIETLQESLEPVGRLASRLPGQSKSKGDVRRD